MSDHARSARTRQEVKPLDLIYQPHEPAGSTLEALLDALLAIDAKMDAILAELRAER